MIDINSTNVDGGWIPYSERDLQGRMLSDEFEAKTPMFEEMNTARADLPERACISEVSFKHFGKAPLRVNQSSGSCVGAGGAQAYLSCSIGDAYYRGETNVAEELILCYPYFTYGHGRYLGGMRRRGSGSYGGAQAKAIADVGMLPRSDSRMPQPKIRDNWAIWSSSTEIEWSYSPQNPIKTSELRPDSEKYKVNAISRVRGTDIAKQSIAQGYALTLASGFGFKSERITGNVCLASRSGSWAHQMSCDGYWEHPELGLIFLINNQWNKYNKTCPTASEWGTYGSFWIKEDVFQDLMERGEVYSHSDSSGFPTKTIDWSDLGLGR